MNIPLKKESLPFFFIFFFQGAFYAQTTSSLPVIKEAFSFTDSQVGTGFFCIGIGFLLGLILFAKMSSRIESKTSLKWAALGMLLWAPCVSLGLSASILNVLGVLFGILLGIYQGSRNVQGILHERQCGRNVMGLLYAGVSLGGMAGSLMTSFLLGGVGVSAFVRLVIFLAVFGGAMFFVPRYLVPGSISATIQQDEKKPSKSRLPILVIVLGIMSLGIMNLETVVGSWGGILLERSKGATTSISAMSYAFTAFGLFISSLLSDDIRGRFGARCTSIVGLLVAWGGLLFSVYIPNPFLALFGFFVIGVGIAPVYPIIMSAVGFIPGVNIAHASAIVSLIGNVGFIMLPGVQGFLAENFSIEISFLFAVIISFATTFLGSFALKSKK